MNTDELKTILEQHKLWLEDEGGARANLRGAGRLVSGTQDSEGLRVRYFDAFAGIGGFALLFTTILEEQKCTRDLKLSDGWLQPQK